MSEAIDRKALEAIGSSATGVASLFLTDSPLSTAYDSCQIRPERHSPLGNMAILSRPMAS
jgi:hypothetical protein